MSGKRHTRDPRSEAKRAGRVLSGTPVYFERETVRGRVRVYGVVDSYPDEHNRELIIRTKTGRNVRISPSLIHRA